MDKPEIKELCSFELFNIPKEDYDEFTEIAKRYRGNSFAPALREMIARYHIFDLLASLREEINELRGEIESLKPTTKKVKTMRGEISGKIRQTEGKDQEG